MPRRAKRLAPYRAGYTPAQRREIEQRLMAGELLGVSATDALELGIDIGSLDCAISVGFPGTVSSLRQQWGRAGRRGPGLAVLIASEDALDQFFMREPEALLGRTVEAAILDHANPRVLDGHVLSAAFEGPIDERDAADPRPGGARARRRAAGAEADAGRLGLGRHRLPGRTRGAALGRPRLVHGRRRRDGLRARLGRALARVLDRPRGRDLPPPRRAAPRAHARPRGAARRVVSRAQRRLVHAGEEGDADGDRRAAAQRAPARSRALLRPRLGDRAGRRLPAQVDQRRRHARDGAARPARDELRDRGDLVLPDAARSSRASRTCRSCSPRSTPPSTR